MLTNRYFIPGLAALVVLSVIAQFLAADSGPVAAVAGLVLVLGGTVLVACVSHSRTAVVALVPLVRSLRRPAEPGMDRDALALFLQGADWYRRGDVRRAEAYVNRVQITLPGRGARLILDGFPRDHVTRVLEWQIAEEREQERRQVELVKALAGYAPAFGMLGTLLGLAQMLFGIGSDDLTVLGPAMGFAMLTTVYGLVLSNLLLKPLASKLDQRGRARMAARVAQLQAVLMFSERQHSQLIRETMDTLGGAAVHPPRLPAAAATPLRLVSAGRG